MLILHLSVSLAAALAASIAAWFAGHATWAVVGCYVLGGNIGLLVGASVMLLRPGQRLRSQEAKQSRLGAAN